MDQTTTPWNNLPYSMQLELILSNLDFLESSILRLFNRPDHPDHYASHPPVAGDHPLADPFDEIRTHLAELHTRMASIEGSSA